MISTAIKSMNFVSNTKLKVALCQVFVKSEKLVNIERVKGIIATACQKPTDIVVLPEIWNSPYATTSFPMNAEILPDIGQQPDPIDSPSSAMMRDQAIKFGIWLIGGSIPEKEIDIVSGKEKVYNTCLIFNPIGEVVGKHRKVHLFDIDVPGKMKFKESDSLTAGDKVCIVETPWGKLGVGICYDLRFPELAMIMRSRGCNMIFFPGAFNMVTGPAHWELLQRARAVDNQLYVVACSPARDEISGGYVAWGHSSVISPWGEVIASAGVQEEILYSELDIDNVDAMRQSIPCWSQKRLDVYEIIDKTIE
jgi:omega-amidase